MLACIQRIAVGQTSVSGSFGKTRFNSFSLEVKNTNELLGPTAMSLLQ
jgi:hypothetical protein